MHREMTASNPDIASIGDLLDSGFFDKAKTNITVDANKLFRQCLPVECTCESPSTLFVFKRIHCLLFPSVSLKNALSRNSAV